MLRIPASLALLIIMLMCSTGRSQETHLPIAEWKYKLSIKEDPGSVQRNEVYKELIALDAPRRCEAMALLREHAGRKNPRARIRLALLEVGSNLCTRDPANPDVLDQALRLSYEIDDQLLGVDVNLALGQFYTTSGERELSVIYYLNAKKMMEEEGLHRFNQYAINLYKLADLLYYSKDYRTAAQISSLAVSYHGREAFNQMDSLDNYWEMNTWNVLGLSYKQLGIYDSAFYAFHQAYQLADNDVWRGLLQGNRGDIFFLQGRYDSAEALLRLDYDKSLAAGEFDNAALSLQRLAIIVNSRGNHRDALDMLKEANMLEQNTPRNEYRMHILHAFAVVYKDLGQADSSFANMERYTVLKELSESRAANSLIEIARLRFDNADYVHELRNLTKERNRIVLIRNFSIAIILIFALTGYLYINRLRLKSMLRQKEAIEAQLMAEAQAENAKEQLNAFTERLREKTRLIEDLQSVVIQKVQDKVQIEQIQQLTEQAILTDEDWERFKNLFNKVYPGFFVELKQRIPDITLAEQRMAALIKLQLSIKDAASMLGISPNSIYKTRQRLRSRLELDQDADLDHMFLSM